MPNIASDEESSKSSATKYFIRQLKKYFGCVLVAAILLLILQLILYGFDDFISVTINFLLQISFISQLLPLSYLGKGGYLWFLSASLWGGSICIFIKSLLDKKANYVFGVGALLLYCMVLSIFNTIDVWWESLFYGMIMTGLIRGLAGIMLGIVLHNLAKKFEGIKLEIRLKYFSMILMVVIVIIEFIGTTMVPSGHFTDTINILAFSILLLFSTLHTNSIHMKHIEYLDKICVPLYIFQVPVIIIVDILVYKSVFGLILTLIIDLSISLIWVYFSLKKSQIFKNSRKRY